MPPINLDGLLSVTGAPGVLALLAWLWFETHSLKRTVKELEAIVQHARAYSVETRIMVERLTPHDAQS